MVKFFTHDEFKDKIRANQTHILLSADVLERVCPVEFKRMVYLTNLYDLELNDFLRLFVYGTGKKESYTEIERYNLIAKVEDSIYALENTIEPLFGILKCETMDNLPTPVFYVDYDPKKASNYLEYDLHPTELHTKRFS